MGCKFSKNDQNSSKINMPNSNEEFKARLERKICLVRFYLHSLSIAYERMKSYIKNR